MNMCPATISSGSDEVATVIGCSAADDRDSSASSSGLTSTAEGNKTSICGGCRVATEVTSVVGSIFQPWIYSPSPKTMIITRKPSSQFREAKVEDAFSYGSQCGLAKSSKFLGSSRNRSRSAFFRASRMKDISEYYLLIWVFHHRKVHLVASGFVYQQYHRL